jgi:hypothetical protein
VALIEIKANPSRRELLWFGVIALAVFALIGGVVYWRAESLPWAAAVWCVGVAFSGLFYAVRPLRLPMYRAWMYAIYPIGFAVSHALLAATFYLVFTPLGLLMRLVGYDPLRRPFEPDANTYWRRHDPGADSDRYFRTF